MCGEITYNTPGQWCNLHFKKSVDRWDEAIPLGNGLTGCLIWGDGKPLRMSLDRGDLWDTRLAQETLHADFTYKNLIQLVKNKDQCGIRERFDACYSNALPTKIPAGRIEIEFEISAVKVESRLILADALAEVKLEFEEKSAIVKSFLHATKGYGYISITGNAGIPKINLKAPEFGNERENGHIDNLSEKGVSSGSLKRLIYPEVERAEDERCSWFLQKTSDGLEYSIVLAQKETPEGLVACYCITTNKDGDDWLNCAKAKVSNALEAGFEENIKSHKEWWNCFWNKSSISLPDKEFEKQWYLTNYLFGSCSRNNAPPMPLQGVWTADEGQLPPWKGDYHNDLNTQMSYYHYAKANHLEEGESFINFLWDLVPQAQKFARDFFDAPGLSLPAVMSIDGKPLGGWPMYSLNLTNQIWLCQSFERHWRYTGDEEFLREKAYPYFKQSAECIMRWLEENESGKLQLPLSSSPEIHNDSLESWLTPNSNYDLALLIYMFKTLIEFSDLLRNGDRLKWLEVLSKLPELAVNEKSVLMLSPDESLKESHRHFSHAMSIHPLFLLDYNSGSRDKEIIDSTVGDLEVLGSGLWVGFSFTWMSELYALQGNGEGAAYQLKLFWENLCSQNGFHLNGDFKNRGIASFHYRPFTLESNMCAADALQEMLLQTYEGVIRTFPAVPDNWKEEKVSFENFRGERGVLISASMKDGKTEYIILKAQHSGIYRVQNNFKNKFLNLFMGDAQQRLECTEQSIFEVKMNAGEECKIISYLI